MISVTENMSLAELRAAIRELQERSTPKAGAGAPTANARFIGDEYQDTTAVAPAGWFKAISVGSGAADWVAIS